MNLVECTGNCGTRVFHYAGSLAEQNCRKTVPSATKTGAMKSAALNPPTPTSALAPDTPVIAMNAVSHVGTFNPEHQKTESYEGFAGISVSRDPDAWREIARLGTEPEWQLELPDRSLRFVDAHHIDFEHVAAHCVAAGYVTETTVWTVSYWDDEMDDTMTFTMPTLDEAENEASEYDDAAVTETVGYETTDALETKVGGNRDRLADRDHMTVAWALDATDADGVW